MKIDRENFWNTIEEWTDTKSDSLHLFGKYVEFHESILEEAKNFDGGTIHLMERIFLRNYEII